MEHDTTQDIHEDAALTDRELGYDFDLESGELEPHLEQLLDLATD